jgi:hypothetical protein
MPFSLNFNGGGGGRGWNRWNDYWCYGPYWGGPWGYGYPCAGYAVPTVPLTAAQSADK